MNRTKSMTPPRRSPAALMVIGAILLALAGCRRPARPPLPAETVIAAATQAARDGQRVVLVEFGASWCTWCKRFDAFVNAPAVKPIIDRNYVVTHLTVREHDGKNALDNPGGEDRLDAWGGADGGIPFYVFLDATGAKIATSNAMPDGTNIGFPGNPREVDAFMTLLASTAPHLDEHDRAVIQAYLRNVVPNS